MCKGNNGAGIRVLQGGFLLAFIIKPTSMTRQGLQRAYGYLLFNTPLYQLASTGLGCRKKVLEG